MSVNETIDLGDGHSIEIGPASWDDAKISIKNHFAKSENGRASPSKSSEFPLSTIAAIVSAIAERDLIEVDDTARLIELLTASLARRAGSSAYPSLKTLLEKVTDENRHPEIETGPAVGNEAW